VLNASLPGSRTLAYVVAWTVILSILVHGVTAIPWAKAFGRREQAADGKGRS
jgi:NhaP-type Na+/H+ or K+/H+ antiporter